MTMNGVVHFEIPVDDMSRARTFYKTVFDWKLQDFPMPDGSTYVGVHTTPVDEKTHIPKEPGAINGGMMMRTEDVCTPVFAVNVVSVDAAVRAVEKAGGWATTPTSRTVKGTLSDFGRIRNRAKCYKVRYSRVRASP